MDKMRMMLVDDEEGFLSTTKKLLERKGVQVTTASSGHEALEKLAGESVHVVILDVKMPGMDGVAVLKAVKSRYPLVQPVPARAGGDAHRTRHRGLCHGGAPIRRNRLPDETHRH